MHLLDWTVIIQGYTVIGGDSRIQRVMRTHRMQFEDKEVVDHFFDSPDDDDLSAFGDDDFVYKLVKRGQEPVEDIDELNQIVKEMRLRKRTTPNPEP